MADVKVPSPDVQTMAANANYSEKNSVLYIFLNMPKSSTEYTDNFFNK